MRINSSTMKYWHGAIVPMFVIAATTTVGDCAFGQTLPSQLTTFANYDQMQGAPGQTFQYTDTFGPTGNPNATVPAAVTGTFSVSAAPVAFSYLVPSSYNNNTVAVPAYFSFSGDAVGAATVVGGFANQAVDNIVGSFTAVTPDSATGKTNLLTLTFTSGNLLFDEATGAATFVASVVQPVAGPPGVSGYKSDFLDFNNPTATNQYYKSEQFSIALSAVNSPGGSSGLGPVVDSNGTIESFSADSSGTFSSNPAPVPPSSVPDASALALSLFGMALGGVRIARSRMRGTISQPLA